MGKKGRLVGEGENGRGGDAGRVGAGFLLVWFRKERWVLDENIFFVMIAQIGLHKGERTPQ